MIMNKMAAIYARVSSDQQKEQNTIASQTAALREYAQGHQYTIAPQWVFEDEGYSGSILARPGLERLRDLIAEGAIETLLVYSPDRLSRKYAYQVLLLEEFGRHGTETIFLNAPSAQTPEQHLLLQFQGMIAEYERAQIAERCRRGKRHRAKCGSLNVLANPPYGYRYIKKTDSSAGHYQVVESEAEVVRKVFSLYTEEHRSIRFLTEYLNSQNIATRFKKGPWIASTLWHLLTNPAYCGRAAYGKTERRPAQRVTRTSRQKGYSISRSPSRRQRPKEAWIEIPVPALVSQQTFDLAQERLAINKQLAARRTKEPSILQGIIICGECGYALCRVRAKTPGGRLQYYRCLGLDKKTPQGRVCNCRPVRLDQADQLVWEQIWALLNHPELIRGEIERRLQDYRQSSPVAERQDKVSQELVRREQQIDKLIDAYQEGLIDLAELRQRVPELQQRRQILQKELESLKLQALEQTRLMDVTFSMEKFVETLKNSAQNLSTEQKQKIVRTLVKQVVVDRETITIHHNIPLFRDPTGQKPTDYRLCTRRSDG